MRNKNSLFRQAQRMFLRRKWLVLLILLPLFIPVQTIRPHYKVTLKIKLTQPDYKQSHAEYMNWLNEQVNILNSEELLVNAMERCGFLKNEIGRHLPFIKNNLDVSAESNDTLRIELAMPEKNKLKALANEVVTLYFDIVDKKIQLEKTKIYESQTEQIKPLSVELKNIKPLYDAAKTALEDFQKNKTIDDSQQIKAEIERLRLELSKIRAVYTEEHPQVKEIVNQISIKTQDLNAMQLKLGQENKKEKALISDYQLKKEPFDKILEKYNKIKANIESLKSTNTADLISRSEVVGVNTINAGILDITGKLILGIIVALGMGTIFERTDKAIWGEDEIRRDLGIRALGTIIKEKKQATMGLLIDYPKNSLIVESFEALRSNIQFINLATPLKSILYSSLLNESDILAGNLAISMAFIGGNVGLINISTDTEKYGRLLKNNISGSFCDTVIKNLKILTIKDANALEKHQAEALINDIKNKFDIIIIDSAALVESISCASLATVVDGVIIGAKPRKTQAEYLLRNYKILNELNARALGVVLQW